MSGFLLEQWSCYTHLPSNSPQTKIYAEAPLHQGQLPLCKQTRHPLWFVNLIINSPSAQYCIFSLILLYFPRMHFFLYNKYAGQHTSICQNYSKWNGKAFVLSWMSLLLHHHRNDAQSIYLSEWNFVIIRHTCRLFLRQPPTSYQGEDVRAPDSSVPRINWTFSEGFISCSQSYYSARNFE